MGLVELLLEVRVSRVLNIMFATAALLMSASALSWGWEAGSRLTLVTGDGARVVGVGSVENERLGLTLARGFNGFAVLMVESADGTLSTVDVMVESDGSILISEEGDFSELETSARASGLSLDLAVEAAAEEDSRGERARAAAGEAGGNAGAEQGPRETGLERAEEAAGGAGKGLERAGEVGNRARESGQEAARESARGAGRRAGGASAGAEEGVAGEVETDESGLNIGVGAGGSGGE